LVDYPAQLHLVLSAEIPLLFLNGLDYITSLRR